MHDRCMVLYAVLHLKLGILSRVRSSALVDVMMKLETCTFVLETQVCCLGITNARCCLVEKSILMQASGVPRGSGVARLR